MVGQLQAPGHHKIILTFSYLHNLHRPDTLHATTLNRQNYLYSRNISQTVRGEERSDTSSDVRLVLVMVSPVRSGDF